MLAAVFVWYQMGKTATNNHEWMDLRRLQDYATVSERTLRSWIHSADRPLPACRVGAKIMVKRSEFDAWMEKHRIQSVALESVESIVGEMLRSVVN